MSFVPCPECQGKGMKLTKQGFFEFCLKCCGRGKVKVKE